MNFHRIFFSLLFVAIAAPIFAQCSSHKKTATAVNTSWTHEKDIIDIAAGNDDFSTLVTAIKTADLVNTLKSDGPFTVFAPVNAAFAKLPEGTVKSLLQPESRGALTKILTYHVVAGEFKATDVINAVNASDGEFSIETVSGGILKVTVENGTVLLTDENGNVAAVTATDVDASNGVIHIIDSVVLPK